MLGTRVRVYPSAPQRASTRSPPRTTRRLPHDIRNRSVTTGRPVEIEGVTRVEGTISLLSHSHWRCLVSLVQLHSDVHSRNLASRALYWKRASRTRTRETVMCVDESPTRRGRLQ